VAVLATAVALLYLHGLGSPRIYLSVEEALQALQADSLAATGRDLTGQLLPLYPSEPWYTAGRDPWVYTAAALLRVAPFSEAIVRFPSAIAGIVNVFLMFLIARRIVGKESTALLAAGLLALTPAHFFQSRIATSQIAPVPFLLAWLLFLLEFIESRRISYLFASTAMLGAGTYTYLSAVFLTPCCFLATLLVVGRHAGALGAGSDSDRFRKASMGVACAGFAIALLPFLAWHLSHPERIGQLLGYYSGNGYNADLAVAGMSPATRIGIRIDAWWESLNPAAMFLTGDGNLRFSTRRAGHFLLPTFAFFVAGAVALAREDRLVLFRPLLLTGLILAPLPAVLATNSEIKRWLAFVPFAILVAACGIQYLLDIRRGAGRWVVAALVVVSATQFSDYLFDYWTGYRERSYFYYGGDLAGAVRRILATTDGLRCVMIDRRVPVLDYWLLYTRTQGRDRSAQSPRIVDSDTVDITAPLECRRSALLVHEHVVATGALEDSLIARGWTKEPILEPGNHHLLTLFWHSRTEKP